MTWTCLLVECSIEVPQRLTVDKLRPLLDVSVKLTAALYYLVAQKRITKYVDFGWLAEVSKRLGCMLDK